jgi:hypothetical protein
MASQPDDGGVGLWWIFQRIPQHCSKICFASPTPCVLPPGRLRHPDGRFTPTGKPDREHLERGPETARFTNLAPSWGIRFALPSSPHRVLESERSKAKT